jgi:hypothetical protein
LVVIVVFLIGILAVVQIFPKGFQILVTTRNNSVAAHLAEDEQERLKEHADQLPQEIIAVRYVNGIPVVDPTRNPFDLGPQGDAVSSSGALSLSGSSVGNWLLYSGPNSFRRVIAEGSRVPAPRPVGSNYGGLMLLGNGPIDVGPGGATNPNLSAYANDFTKDLTLPSNLEISQSMITISMKTSTGSSTVSASLYDASDTLSPTEYFVQSPTTSNASLLLPTNPSFSRNYHIRLAAYLSTGLRKDYPDLAITVPSTSATDAAGYVYPLVSVSVSSILSGLGQLEAGENVTAVDYDSIQIAPEFELIATTASWGNDPLQYKLLDPNLGVLLFNPVAYSTTIEHPGGAREPLEAKVDYDVYDWRILRQEFRLDDQQNLNGSNYGQFTLALQSLKVGSNAGPDGLKNDGIIPLEGAHANPVAGQTPNADNFVLVDMQTGGIVYEVDPNNTTEQILTVNKSTGLVTVNSDGSGTGLMGYLAIPGTSGATAVNLAGRSLRALYRARQEFSVNLLKSAASYAIVEAPTNGQPLGQGTVASIPTLSKPGGLVLQFPTSDAHEQVVIDTVNYIDYTDSSHPSLNILNGQSFSIEIPPQGGPPEINFTNVLPTSSKITSIQGIKGSSLVVQVLWNPNTFALGPSGTANIGLINSWEHGWRRNINQSNIPAQELQ